MYCPKSSLKIYISTGERSGAHYAKLISKEILQKYPNAKFVGSLNDENGELAPVGFAGGGKAAVTVFDRIKAIERDVRRQGPNVFLAVAWSEPNIMLGMRLRNIKTMKRLFFAPPQLWAWGQFRKSLLKRGYDELLCLYPREVRFLLSLGLPARFRGNPLVGYLAPYFKTAVQAGENRLIAIMPGSRAVEKKRNYRLLKDFSSLWKKNYPTDRIVWIFMQADEAKRFPDCSGEKISGQERYEILSKANLAIVNSGTASLEVALIGTPQIVFYTMPAVEVFLAKVLSKVKYFALPNIILNADRVSEFLNPTVKYLFESGCKVIDEQKSAVELAEILRRELRVQGDSVGFL